MSPSTSTKKSPESWRSWATKDKLKLLDALRHEAARKSAIDVAPRSFREYVDSVKRDYVWYRHCAELAEVLQRVADGEIKRLMVFMPPREGKSELVSRLFSGYYLERHPNRWVGINSYAADLSHTLSRASQEHYLQAGGMVKSNASAIKHWETPQGGGMWAAGVGGPITGKGFHLGIIDDALKNAEEAASATIREKHKEWYRSTFYTREEPGGAIIEIQTRWHEDDLAGWLLSEESGEYPEKWHVVNLAAIAEGQKVFPPSCTVQSDWREIGEALNPERRSVAKLEQIAARIGSYFFGALYQQNPTLREGAFFKVEQFQFLDVAPRGLRECRAWDIASSAGNGDRSAGVKIGTDGQRFFITHATAGNWLSDERNARMRSTAEIDGQSVKIHLPQDPGAAGKDNALALTRMLAGFSVKSEPVSGKKETRADPLASQVNAGNVTIIKGDWDWRGFVEELRQFPQGKRDDQVDAAADAFVEVALTGASASPLAGGDRPFVQSPRTAEAFRTTPATSANRPMMPRVR